MIMIMINALILQC